MESLASEWWIGEDSAVDGFLICFYLRNSNGGVATSLEEASYIRNALAGMKCALDATDGSVREIGDADLTTRARACTGTVSPWSAASTTRESTSAAVEVASATSTPATAFCVGATCSTRAGTTRATRATHGVVASATIAAVIDIAAVANDTIAVLPARTTRATTTVIACYE